MKPLGSVLKPLEGLVEHSWGPLGPSSGPVGGVFLMFNRSEADLASFWKCLGASWKHLGGVLEASWRRLGGALGNPEMLYFSLGALLGALSHSLSISK